MWTNFFNPALMPYPLLEGVLDSDHVRTMQVYATSPGPVVIVKSTDPSLVIVGLKWTSKGQWLLCDRDDCILLSLI